MTALRKKDVTPLAALLCEVAAASLAVCLFSTLTAPEILALRTPHAGSEGRSRSADHLRLFDWSSAADVGPLVRKSNARISPSFVSAPRSGVKEENKPHAELLTNLIKTGLLDVSDAPPKEGLRVRMANEMDASLTEAGKELRSLVKHHTETVGAVSEAITQAIDDVSNSVGQSLVDVATLAPVMVVAASVDLQRQIDRGGLALIDSIKQLTEDVTKAAANATKFIRDVVTNKHPKYRLGYTLKRWKTKAASWGKGKFSRLRRLGSSMRARARKYLLRKSEEAGSATGDEGLSDDGVPDGLPAGDLRETNF